MNADVLRKVEALLATANHPGTPQHEAETASAMAEKLMMKHSLDESMLNAAKGAGQRGKVTSIKVEITGSYAGMRAILLNEVSNANRCKAIRLCGGKHQILAVYGYQAAIDNVQAMYDSLSVQMVNATMKAPAPAWCTGAKLVSFRHSFQLGFVNDVTKRLREQLANATAEAKAVHGPNVGLVLVSEADAVKAAFKAAHPSTTANSRSSAHNRAGYNAGNAAGGRADIGNKRIGGGARAIGAGR